MTQIKETIVVEGRDDKRAVLAAVEANVLCTSGFGLNDLIVSDIRSAYEKTGIIIFTDPDHAGRTIRERLTELFPDAKQAYLTKSQSLKKGDVGIENANPGDILRALGKACAEKTGVCSDITMGDLFELGLTGNEDSSSKREKVGKDLGIGYANTKSFLKRLRYTGVSRKELEDACERII